LLASVLILYYLGAFRGGEYVPRYCSLQPGLSCTSYAIVGNESGITVVFTGQNGLGYDIGFDANAVSVTAENLGLAGEHTYTGTCSPSVVRKGRTYTCIVGIPFTDRMPPFGSMQRTQVLVTYKNCESDPDYHTTRNCNTPATTTHYVRGELVSQFEPYAPKPTCGNGECDDNLGEDAANCPADCLPVPFTLTLVANPSSIPADGSSTSVITATLYDQFGSPYPGATIYFSKNSTNGSLSALMNVTDSQGMTTTTFTAGTSPETILINASINASFFNEVLIQLRST